MTENLGAEAGEATPITYRISMSPVASKAIYFGSFLVTPQASTIGGLTPDVPIDSFQVFHLTPLSFALVNLKPLLPGHVLVSPRRKVPRFSELSQDEVADLFLTVQRVGRMVERVFQASSLNIAIQDGVDAGQSVPHVHAHIIPRKNEDLKDRGGGDAIYGMLDGEEGDVGAHLMEHKRRSRFPAVDADESRKPRTEEEMRREAEWFAEEMEKS